MLTKLTHVSIPVTDYDQAINWYTEKLGLQLTSNQEFAPGARWVTVAVHEAAGPELVLHKPFPGQDVPPVTHYVFATNDCRGDVARMQENGITILTEPEEQMWGIQAIFADPFGNSFVLVEEKPYQG